MVDGFTTRFALPGKYPEAENGRGRYRYRRLASEGHGAHDCLSLHPRRPRPFDQGRLLAASIPNAKIVALDSENHALLSDEPAWAKFVGEMEAFLADQS